jgi:hypothetical protein
MVAEPSSDTNFMYGLAFCILLSFLVKLHLIFLIRRRGVGFKLFSVYLPVIVQIIYPDSEKIGSYREAPGNLRVLISILVFPKSYF